MLVVLREFHWPLFARGNIGQMTWTLKGEEDLPDHSRILRCVKGCVWQKRGAPEQLQC
jgi:hypothetical protein